MYIHGIHTHIYIHVKHEVGFPFKPMQEALGPNTGNIYENLKKSLCSYFFMRIHKNFSGRPGSKCGKLTQNVHIGKLGSLLHAVTTLLSGIVHCFEGVNNFILTLGNLFSF